MKSSHAEIIYYKSETFSTQMEQSWDLQDVKMSCCNCKQVWNVSCHSNSTLNLLGFIIETDGLTGEFIIFNASQRHNFNLPTLFCGGRSHEYRTKQVQQLNMKTPTHRNESKMLLVWDVNQGDRKITIFFFFLI